MKPLGAGSRLAALTLAVLAAHLAVLQGANRNVRVAEPVAAKAMWTRTIVAGTAAAAKPDEPVFAAQKPQVAVAKAPARGPAKAASPIPARSPEGGGSNPTPGADTGARPRVTSAPALPVAIPASTRLSYVVTASSRGRQVEGRSQLSWSHDGDSYEARLEINAPSLPARTQESRGQITADGLAPARFSDRYRGEQAAHFERATGKVVFSANSPQADLLPGAQDRLSVVVQLAALVAGAPSKFRAGSAITVQTAGTRDAQPWVFTVEGEENLQLPGGDVTTLKLVRAPQREYDQRVELWLGPGQAYVPVRLRLTNSNGDWIDQQWSATDRP